MENHRREIWESKIDRNYMSYKWFDIKMTGRIVICFLDTNQPLFVQTVYRSVSAETMNCLYTLVYKQLSMSVYTNRKCICWCTDVDGMKGIVRPKAYVLISVMGIMGIDYQNCPFSWKSAQFHGIAWCRRLVPKLEPTSI